VEDEVLYKVGGGGAIEVPPQEIDLTKQWDPPFTDTPQTHPSLLHGRVKFNVNEIVIWISSHNIKRASLKLNRDVICFQVPFKVNWWCEKQIMGWMCVETRGCTCNVNIYWILNLSLHKNESAVLPRTGNMKCILYTYQYVRWPLPLKRCATVAVEFFGAIRIFITWLDFNFLIRVLFFL
jgi:hypothetical protein